ncbi:hypothetical protein ICM_06204 [Bacillus cereus BAG1X2-3]|uniref:Uncharacterized protein n=1 Tax=Bacillus cereus TaxID=1396 RepID=A0A9X7E1U6_BACCE|nr:hypothetical protein [Bacillus cereus]EOO22981.1 hypothetical protein ICC_06351 [Bacillus cereus BAG1X1-1]EOO42761.1 hypothetical protein ICI_06268 [Bacillus cereus BAG1X2-1]EOO43873.1 hypothetical protein ICK_06566 [Bacillus cereus BAG1X2-2]EOO55903.1 hypothetical protein ICM_06204 [Bacillus cereus BAG1X2-3]EOO99982.1 hypothetical protein ICO_06614 [Bacillus cereus BAG2O-1]
MELFRDKLMLGAIPISQIDKNGFPLCQFDEVRYKEKQYIIIWHPLYNEFVASHYTGEFIRFSVLDKVEYIRNLKKSYSIERNI